jgi:hypothetical protein
MQTILETTASPRFIVGIFPDGEEEAQCIRIAHPSRMYLTDDYIPTHNSWEPESESLERAATMPRQAFTFDQARKEAKKFQGRPKEENQSFRDIERAYGGRTAYEKAEAAGRTKLDYRQWVQVRTPEFKEWFGDWEAAFLHDFLNGPPVAVLEGNQAPMDKGFAAVRAWASEIFERQGGKAINPELGDVALDKRAVRDSQGHGGTNRAKAEAFAAVKDVIEQGRIILRKTQGELESIFVSAPVRISGVDDVVTVLVHHDQNTQRMYLHSVTTKESLLDDRVSSAGAEAPRQSGSSRRRGVFTILHDALNFKGEVSQVIAPETFEPRVVSGMFVKAQSNSFDKLPKSALAAYNAGKRLGERFQHKQAAFLDALASDLDVPHDFLDFGMDGYFFDRGFNGESAPSRFVFAERIGNLPGRGVSYNYRDERHEKGVSVLGLLDPDLGLVSQNDGMFEAFNPSRNRNYIGGWLIEETGSDGEPLLLGAKQFKDRVQIKSATANNGAFSRKNDDILFSVPEEVARQVRIAREGALYEKADLAKNPDLAPEAQAILVKDEDLYVRMPLARNSNLTPELQLILAKDRSKDLRITLAENPRLTPEAQAILVGDENWEVRRNLTPNPKLTPEAQAILARDENDSVRQQLTENHNLTPEAQAILAKDANRWARRNLAQNPNLTPEVQVILAKDKNDSVSGYLAENPHLTPEAQAILVKDENWEVRGGLAKNPDLAPEAQAILAKDENWEVRKRLAKNPNLTPETQAILAKDEEYLVRGYLAKKPKLTPEAQLILAKDENWEVRRELAQNPNLTPEVQVILAKDKNDSVSKYLVKNPNLTPEVQAILARDESVLVRGNLAQNPILTPEVQAILARDENVWVRMYLAPNASLTPEAQAILVKDENLGVRRELAINPRLTPETQAILARDESWIRALLINNPGLAPEIADELVQTANAEQLKSLSEKHNTPAIKARAAALLKELQGDTSANAKDIAQLMETGLIDIPTISAATFNGIHRWRRELTSLRNKTTDADTRLSAVARKLGMPKDALASMLRKSLGRETADEWVRRDRFSRAELEQAAGKPGLLYLREMKRGGAQAPGEDEMDSAISFFDPDMPEKIQQAFSKSQVASSHPAGFGFSLFRRFGRGRSNVMMTEIQSDIMSYLFDPRKEDAAREIWGDELDAARESFRPKQQTWVKEIFRNTVRYLFNHGVKRVYAITPESLTEQLDASPPVSVMNEWIGESAARKEGFGGRTKVRVGGIEYEVWDAIDKDSEAGQEILFSMRKTEPQQTLPSPESEEVIDFSSDARFHHLFHGTPSEKQIQEFDRWLKANPDALIRLYHGTSSLNPIETQGLKKTSATRRNSLQSRSGYVYLSVYPGIAQDFARFASANRGANDEGFKNALYSTELRISELSPDADQLRNQRMFAGRDVKNTLAHSLVFGRGARFKGNIPASRVDREIYFSARPEEENQSFRDTERAYGGRTAHEKAEAAGKTKLDYRQWVQVRTPEFKKWFGDWEALSLRRFLEGDPVSTLTGEEFKPDGIPLTRKVPKWYADNGFSRVDTPEIGEVALDERAVKDSIAHGIRRDKAAAFAAVPDVLKNGRIAHREPVKGGPGGSMMYHVVAPVKIGGKAMVMDVLVRSDANANRMYVHEVALRERLQTLALKTGADTKVEQPSGASDAGAISTIGRGIFSVNPDAVSKVIDEETGEPRVVYHGTQRAGFTVFRTGIGGRGKYRAAWFSDSPVVAESYSGSSEIAEDHDDPESREPDFTRTNRKIYAAFLNMRNPEEHDANGKSFGDINGKPTWEHAHTAWERGADGAVFKNIRDDGGHADTQSASSTVYSVFSPNQIKSATANNGAFSRNNDDILFSVKKEESTGHAQPLTAKVLTPSGFRRMGDIRAGDEVITPDGSATKVTDVFPQGVQPVWRIVLSDGSQTRTTLDHLWRVRPEGEKDFRVMTLSEIMPGIAAGKRYELPEVAV